jgi:hypothetical protein
VRVPIRRPRPKLRRCPATGKIKHRDEIAAKIALGILASRPLRVIKEQRVYLCHLCKGWHLTSQERKS